MSNNKIDDGDMRILIDEEQNYDDALVAIRNAEPGTMCEINSASGEGISAKTFMDLFEAAFAFELAEEGMNNELFS